MTRTFTACSFAAAVLLTGCATTEAPKTAATAAPQTATEGAKVEHTLTGSRLAKGSGDRHLRSVGNQSARDEFNATSMGNLVGIKGN